MYVALFWFWLCHYYSPIYCSNAEQSLNLVPMGGLDLSVIPRTKIPLQRFLKLEFMENPECCYQHVSHSAKRCKLSSTQQRS